jgi:nucleoside-diphosphate-sugar epimerase
MNTQSTQVVFGGAGLMGEALLKKLLNEGSQGVTVCDLKTPSLEIMSNSRIRFVKANVVELGKQAIEDILGNAETLFFKVGMLGDPRFSCDIAKAWDFINVNALALARVIPVLKGSRVRTLIVDSSITAVSDFSRNSPIRELDGIGLPTNFYGVSKAILEDICALNHNQDHLKIRVIRYPRVYSPTQKSFLINFARKILSNKPIYLTGNPHKLLDLIHIEDAVEVAFRCMKFEGDEKIFHASYGNARTLRKIIDLLFQYAGNSSHPVILLNEGESPREPVNASLADGYSSRKLGAQFQFSLELIVQDALKVAAQYP